MKSALHRCLGKLLHRFHGLKIQRFNDSTFRRRSVFCVALFPLFACAQASFSDPGSVRSVSGQFIVTGAPSRPAGSGLWARPEIATNSDFVRLEPALLAISAERIKEALGRELNPELRGLDLPPPPSGKIFLVLHPAQSTDEGVTIVSRWSPGGWDYQVRLPDVLFRTRYLRAMTGVLLLEFANRNARVRSAEIPAWLTDGLSQELLATAWQEIILSSPNKVVNGLPVSRTVKTTRGMDSLASARRVLRDHPVLTFEQLSSTMRKSSAASSRCIRLGTAAQSGWSHLNAYGRWLAFRHESGARWRSGWPAGYLLRREKLSLLCDQRQEGQL